MVELQQITDNVKNTWDFILFEKVLKYDCLIVLKLLWCIKRINLMSYVLFYYNTVNPLVGSIFKRMEYI